jgi:hypothetical protein
VTDEWLVERDAATFKIISARKLGTIFSLVRPQDDPRTFHIEFDDNASRTYQGNDRDMVLGSLLDAAQSFGNHRVYVSAENSDGLRLTPRFFVEEVKKSSFMKEAFFGPDTIEGWHLKQLSKAANELTQPNPDSKIKMPVVVASLGGPMFDGLIQAAAEFNANVPVTGVDSATDKEKLSKCVAPLLAILNALAGHAERAPDVGKLREVC